MTIFLIAMVLLLSGVLLAAVLGVPGERKRKSKAAQLIEAIMINYEYLNAIHVATMTDMCRWETLKRQAEQMLLYNEIAKTIPGFPTLSVGYERGTRNIISLLEQHEAKPTETPVKKQKKPMPSYLQLVKNDQLN
jgi:hypothetical protein